VLAHPCRTRAAPAVSVENFIIGFQVIRVGRLPASNRCNAGFAAWSRCIGGLLHEPLPPGVRQPGIVDRGPMGSARSQSAKGVAGVRDCAANPAGPGLPKVAGACYRVWATRSPRSPVLVPSTSRVGADHFARNSVAPWGVSPSTTIGTAAPGSRSSRPRLAWPALFRGIPPELRRKPLVVHQAGRRPSRIRSARHVSPWEAKP
jgi:hypothetical protein